MSLLGNTTKIKNFFKIYLEFQKKRLVFALLYKLYFHSSKGNPGCKDVITIN